MKKILTFFALLLLGIVYGQAPNISYASPQSYSVGETITPLNPTNTGGVVAKGATVSLLAGKTPDQDGTGANANFNIPEGVAVDAAGNVYVADTNNHKIRKITPSGVVTTLAGSGSSGATNGVGTAASFNAPASIAVDASGNLYVADRDNHKIRKINPSGVVTTLAGSGAQGAADGIGTAASFAIPNGVAVDADGNVYVADWSNHKIRKITAAGVVTTLAGSGSIGARDGTGIDASFNAPQGVTVDATGNVYVADSYNNKIRKITAAGVVSTFVLRYYSPDNTSPDMYYPRSVAVDAAGNVYVADMYNNRIIKITPEFSVTTLAGGNNGISGDTNGTGKAARFNNPAGIAIDAAGKVYVADSGNTIIRKIDAAGVVTSLAGSSRYRTTDGTGSAASFSTPSDVAVDATGNVYVADGLNKIRKITAAGVVTTLAEIGINGVAVDAASNVYVADSYNNKIIKITDAGIVTTLAGSGSRGATDGIGTAASFNYPSGVAIDADGNVFVADGRNYKIRKITPAGVVTTLAGSGSSGVTDGIGTAASFQDPSGIAVDATGNIYVADSSNQKIRKITPAGVVTTLAGSGSSGVTDGTGTAANFNNPTGVAVDASGNVYVADSYNHKVRKITPAGVVTTLAGIGTAGAIDGTGTAASFNNPTGVAVDAAGNVYVADRFNNKIRKINNNGFRINPTLPAGLSFDETTGVISGTPTVASPMTTYTVTAFNGDGKSITTISLAAVNFSPPKISYASPQSFPVGSAITPLTPTNTGGAVVSSATVSTLAGSTAYGSTDGTGAAASFNYPKGIAVDGAGNIYVADYNHKIRKITATGVVTTLAGNGTKGAADGTDTAASFNNPNGVAVDATGNVYVADTGNHKIRKINAAGVVTTLAGSGTAGATDGTGTAASFNNPTGVAVDAAGNVFVADSYNHKIRKINAAGVVTTLAGNGTQGAADDTGTAASFNYPYGVALDAAGNVYVGDYPNHKIRKITDTGVVTTLAGSGSIGTSLSFPCGVAVDAAGNVFVGGDWIHKIRKITSAGLVSILAGSDTPGATDGTSTTASFNNPIGVAVDAAGNVYVADTNNHKIRKITQVGGYRINPTLPIGLSFDENTGVISGTPTVTSPMTTYTVTASNSDGNSITTISLAVVNLLPPDISYVSPQSYTVGKAITPLIPENTGGLVPASIYGKVTTLAGSGRNFSNDGIGTAASFGSPSGVAVDLTGNVYVADWFSHKIRKITPTMVVSTLAGDGTSGAVEGEGAVANFTNPSDVAVDAEGNVYVADSGNHKIRKISPLGVVTTLAGTGTAGATEGTGTSASFNNPKKVAVDAAGTVYIVDTKNNKIRKISPEGIVTTLAGIGSAGATDGIGTAASFNDPSGIAVDATGNVYVADSGNHKIRKISPAGEVSTSAGNGSLGATDGIGTAASFNYPSGVAIDATGNVYVADTRNNKIRKITFDGIVSSLAGSGISGGVLDQGTDGIGNMATFRYPSDVALDSSCNVYVSEGNHKIRKINTSGYMISPSLPDGLSFDATTGIISGTPTVASPMTTYTVTAYNAFGSATTTIEMGTAVLGTASFTKESLTLFPNPVHNLLQIQSSDNLTIDRVIITDLTGKVILEQALDTNTINIAQLASGMYIIKAFSGQQAFTSKFMKAL